MMATRLVPKEHAQTAADAEAFVVQDTGGAVVPTGKTEKVEGGWAVQCYSTDGLASPVAPGRTLLHVVAISDDGKKARVRDQVGFEFDLPRTLPEFLGGAIVLQAGQNISGVLSMQYGSLKDAVVEDDLKERKEFEGPQEDRRGWEPQNSPAPPAGTVKA
jgi:hypothetical protein